MSELAVKSFVNEPNVAATGFQRRIVSYFDHEFIKPSSAKVERDVKEMTEAGFTNVVLCITEKDIASQSRLDFLTDTVEYMKGKGLEVWADPWSVGNVFGGEGESPFKDSGEKRCMCNPKLDTLICHWLDATVSTGVDTVFWDEPEMKDCRKHRSGEVEFIEKYTAAAGKLALKNVVCLCADYSKMHQFEQIANLPDVIEIATDPYFPYPFRYPKISEDMHLAHMAKWIDFTRKTAEKAGIDWHIWVQAFAIPKGRESMVDEHVDVLRSRGVGSTAVWGFRGCESVPDFVKETDVPPLVLWDRIKRAVA